MNILLKLKKTKFTICRLLPFYIRQMGRNVNRDILTYHNRYYGKKCFVVATGPSLTLNDLELLKNEYTFSMNSIVKLFDKTEWRPSFYFLQDPHAYEALKPLNKYFSDTQIFVSENLPLCKEDKKSSIQYCICPYHDSKHLIDGKVQFQEKCERFVYDGRTITYTILQFAAYMGFKEIYLIGVDANYSSGGDNHMEGLSLSHDRYLEKDHNLQNVCMQISYNSAQKAAEVRGFKIYNAGRNKNLKTYPYVELEDILNESKNL